MPITAFIGVRISWLIVARNALLASLAASAWARASCASLEQLGVLDRDHRLVGEGLEQLHSFSVNGPRLADASAMIAPMPWPFADQRRDDSESAESCGPSRSWC